MPIGVYPRKLRPAPTQAEYIKRIERGSIPEPNSGCWLSLDKPHGGMGYGRIMFHQQKILAHRLSWIAYHGEIPEGLNVLHQCDTPACVNPDHLFLGTNADNNRDRDNKGRQVTLRGEKNGNSKLKPHQVLEIRQSSLSQRKLAEQYGVDQALIYNIRKRLTWTHI